MRARLYTFIDFQQLASWRAARHAVEVIQYHARDNYLLDMMIYYEWAVDNDSRISAPVLLPFRSYAMTIARHGFRFLLGDAQWAIEMSLI